jgi:hypothetical protein
VRTDIQATHYYNGGGQKNPLCGVIMILIWRKMMENGKL